MTAATTELVNELCGIVDHSKFLLLSGASGVGKTFLASEIARQCRMAQYNAQGALSPPRTEYQVKAELVPIHPSCGYEEFVAGTSFQTEDGRARFQYQDKIFLTLLREANRSWAEGPGRKYVLILDDIGRGMISGILGDVLPLIEPHGGQTFHLTLRDGSRLQIPPNFYIIATRSTLTDPVEPSGYGLLRRFHHYHIRADYKYMDDGAAATCSDYDMSANALFCRTRRIISEHLRQAGLRPAQELERYLIGHGVFQRDAAALAMRYQVLPMLKQYVRDHVLEPSAQAGVSALERAVTGNCSKDISLTGPPFITGQRTDVTPDVFYHDDETHRPIANLTARIKTQGLLCDGDIAELILFNPGVLIRKSGTLDGTLRSYPTPAYLYVKRSLRDLYFYGTTHKKDGSPKRPRYFYSAKKADQLVIYGEEYVCAQEMQPKEYTRWSDELNSDGFINERGSSSPNSIMFRILRSYYGCILRRCGEYLSEFPGDENIQNLSAFARAEFEGLIESIKQIGSGSDEAHVNLERNRQFREAVSRLRLLWAEKRDAITWNETTITVEGVYPVGMTQRCKEYSNAMEGLGIHQMILQGPPGTSKTHSAREYLKFVGAGEANDDFLTDLQLDALQIKNYHHPARLSAWVEDNPDQPPPIAWDIVQFHPSYGYEDFVRGIEVSTAADPGGAGSSVSYDTVNKVLGNMAEAASRPGFEGTKFFLVIDEINRANLAAVLGELIYGLEYRGRSVATPYTVDGSNKIQLPGNLYILGTMNTADKSIGGIDYAIRRRFLFFPLLPDREVILQFHISPDRTPAENDAQSGVNEKAARLFDAVAALFGPDCLNPDYDKDDVQIGHTYFLVRSEEQLYLRFLYQIIPILREYHKDGLFQFHSSDGGALDALMDCVSGQTDLSADGQARRVFQALLSDA